MLRWIGMAAALLAGHAVAQDIPGSLPEEIRTIAAETLGDADMAALAAACPDALWNARSFSLGSLLQGCETPGGCRTQCGLGSGDACFDLARTMQEREPEMPAQVSERWFARACAEGHAGGCTNRAAGILLRGEGDPFAARPPVDAEQCAARTFVLSCEADDAWGCTMHARDLAEGVLGERDVSAARAAAGKACLLDEGDVVGACSTAQRWVGD